MKFKSQSVSCFFFFFLTFGMADGRSIGQGIYDVFEHSPISRHVARQNYFDGLSVAI